MKQMSKRKMENNKNLKLKKLTKSFYKSMTSSKKYRKKSIQSFRVWASILDQSCGQNVSINYFFTL